MFRSTDPHHTRKTIAGVCMVLAPLFLLASAVVSPKLDTHEAGMLSNAADHLDRFYLSTVLGGISLILLVPAVLGLMHMLRERRTGAGLVGGGLTLFGAMAAMAGTGVNLVMWQMAAAGNRGEMVALLHRVNHTTGTFVLLYLCTLGIFLGFAVMSYALMAERMVHWSMAAAMTVGVLAVTIAFMAASSALLIIGAAIFFVGLASVGRMILKETDEDWEHTPEFRGFGLAGTA